MFTESNITCDKLINNFIKAYKVATKKILLFLKYYRRTESKLCKQYPIGI